MPKKSIKDYISMNRDLRSRIFGAGEKAGMARAINQDFVLVNRLSSQLNQNTSSLHVFEQLYSIPEVAVCVDFWTGNIGTKVFMFSSKNQKFEDACKKYFNEHEMIPGSGYTFLSSFNANSKDYVFHGNEIYAISKLMVEIDGFKFPKFVIPLSYNGSEINHEVSFKKGCTYSVSFLDEDFSSPNIIICKRMAGVFDPFGRSMMERAIKPVTTSINDSTLDQSVSKMGIMSAFVLVKYGTDSEPRPDEDLQELHEELSRNMESGLAFGVVPPDVSVESLFKSSSQGSFNRDKIFETYMHSIDLAFGGVLNTIAPSSNTGGGSEKSLVFLKNLVDNERGVRLSHIMNPIVNRIRTINDIDEACVVRMSEVDILINTIQESRLKEFDRGIMSTETYLGERFGVEIDRIQKEHDGYRDIIVPRDLPYTQSGSQEKENPEGEEENEEAIQDPVAD